MIFNKNDRVLFIGDSVTDMGRARPVGEGLHDGVGTGYVRTVSNFMNAFYPELNVRISNTGISGNNILALKNRWQEDVLDLNPDWVCMLIGINDVWRQFDCPDILDYHISPKTYENTMCELVERTLPRVKGMILMTPYYIEPLKEDMMRKRMDEYTEIVKKTAEKYNLICVDFQKVYDEYTQIRHSSYITWDRVHPNGVGAMLMGTEFLKAVGFDKNIF